VRDEGFVAARMDEGEVEEDREDEDDVGGRVDERGLADEEQEVCPKDQH